MLDLASALRYNADVKKDFAAIRSLYERLDASLASMQGAGKAGRVRASAGATNPCGKCDTCCRYYFYLARHEFDLIEDHLIRTRGASPIRWVNCSTNIQDARRSRPVDLSYRCPLYEEGVGCTVYEVRPLACRTLGPMLPHHSKLPDWCVFEDSATYSSTDEIPLWKEFLEIIHREGGASRGYFEAAP